MFKGILGLIVSLGFVATSHATKEIQFNGSYADAKGATGGTRAAISLGDDGTEDKTDYGFSVEAYHSLSEVLQVGGLLGYADGDSFQEAAIAIGALVRYNLDADLRNSIFVGGGIRYADFGPGDNIAILASVGKRFAMSETITWTPNVAIALNVAGDLDNGHNINLNILSFSGFLD